jgi:hypothetical protein
MKYFELELNGETIKFRLTSNDCMVIEKKSGVSITEYVQNLSITTVVNLLMYMRRSEKPNFSEKDASALYDKLIDNDFTIATIISDVIMEALAVSGFMSKEELAEMKTKMAK